MNSNNNNTMNDLFGDVISSYSQAQAIEDGVLGVVDAKISREAGFTIPVLATSAVFALLDPKKGAKGNGQSFDGRAWDMLYMLRNAIRRGITDDCSTVTYKCIFLVGRKQVVTTLRAVCGGDDNGAPCITVMLSTED